MNSANLHSRAGRYENPIPPRCLAPIDFLKIPAQMHAYYDIKEQSWRTILFISKALLHAGFSDEYLFFYSFGGIFNFFSYNIQHCFICRPSDFTVPTDAGIEPRTVATVALAVRRSNH
jgi:hypothetical protein